MGGGAQPRISKPFSCNLTHRVGAKSIYKAASMQFVVLNNGGQVKCVKWELLQLDTGPECLTFVYSMSLHVIRSPRPSPSIVAHCK